MNSDQDGRSQKVFSLYQVDLDKIKNDLEKAPKRFSGDESLILKFPDSDGNIRNYIVQEAFYNGTRSSGTIS